MLSTCCAALTIALVLTVPASVAAAVETEIQIGPVSGTAPAPDDVAIPDAPVDLGVVPLPLRVEAGPGVVLTLADGRTLLDTIEIRTAPNGEQILVNELSMDDYVAGVAEMPGRWPMEALKAQAVAARTYAWYSLELGTFQRRGLGYDICDTVDCQVFRGAAQEEGHPGRRWRQAVEETSGEVLVDGQGEPILARYFSTSGGRTLPNEMVFPSSGPRPYLVGIEDPADAVSPLHRWEVRFSREEFESILARGQRLSTVVPIARVEREGPVADPNATLRFVGSGGTEVRLGAVEFRRFVSEVAPQAFPDRFPTMRADGLRPLPTTLPSGRFEVDVLDEEVIVTGRGWGHGVGLGQYGARGRAEQGERYDGILEAYYNGLRPHVSDAAPARIRVGLSQPAVGSIRPDGPATWRADGEVVVEQAVGTWTVSRESGGIRLYGPPGWDGEEIVSATAPAPDAPSRTDAVLVTAATSVPGELALVATDGDGEVVASVPLGAVDAGTHQALWDLTSNEGRPVPTGSYAVTLQVTAASGSVLGAPLPIEVQRPAGFATLTGADGSGLVISLGAVLALLGAVGVLAHAWRRHGNAAPRYQSPDHAAGGHRDR